MSHGGSDFWVQSLGFVFFCCSFLSPFKNQEEVGTVISFSNPMHPKTRKNSGVSTKTGFSQVAEKA